MKQTTIEFYQFKLENDSLCFNGAVKLSNSLDVLLYRSSRMDIRTPYVETIRQSKTSVRANRRIMTDPMIVRILL